MNSRQKIIEYCMTFPAVFEDYPFEDPNWTVMRRQDTRRGFAWIFERQGHIRINLKVEPEDGIFLRSVYPSVLPAYHMNKVHWISVITDGTVPEEALKSMISHSYTLCGKKKTEGKR